MANFVYGKWKSNVMQGNSPYQLNNTGGTIKAALVSASYTPNQNTDQFWSSVNANVIGTPVACAAAPSWTNGIFIGDASDTWSAVSGAAAKYIVIYKDTGTASTSPLICCLDGTFNITIALAVSAATAITADPLAYGLPSGATLTKVSGNAGSPASFTLAAGTVASGARSLTASANVTLSVGDVYSAMINGSNGAFGLPITPNGNNIVVTWDATNGFFAI